MNAAHGKDDRGRRRDETGAAPIDGPADPLGSWGPGGQQIQDLLDLGHLERITVDERFVETQLQDAEDTIVSAKVLAKSNPRLAYGALYDAARWSIEAALAKQGLRPTRQGGHTVAIDALTAQLGNAGAALKPMDRIRKRRHDAEYPYPDTPLIVVADVTDDLPKAATVVSTMRKFAGMVGEF